MSGVLAGVVAASIWTLVVAAVRVYRLKHEFEPLAGTYRVTRKLAAEPEPETLSIAVKKNVLSVQSHGGDGVYSGEIAMNEQLPRSGRGQYQHNKDGVQLWGFWDVQRKDTNILLVHTTYARQADHVADVSGYVWTRIRQ